MGDLLKLYKEEKIYQQETANQHQHRFSTTDTYQVVEPIDSSPIVDIKKDIYLKEDGRASITLDILHLERYVLAIGNRTDEEIVFTVSYSPDGDLFKQFGSRKKVAAHVLEVAKSDSMLRYLKVSITGIALGRVSIYLQARNK